MPLKTHRIDITGLDKAAILVSLYNNAANSKKLKRRNHLGDINVIHPIDINYANKLLGNDRRIYSIGCVLIKINFSSSDSIDTSHYDREYSDVDSANVVINRLKKEILVNRMDLSP